MVGAQRRLVSFPDNKVLTIKKNKPWYIYTPCFVYSKTHILTPVEFQCILQSMVTCQRDGSGEIVVSAFMCSLFSFSCLYRVIYLHVSFQT